jgi:hypothetical protein
MTYENDESTQAHATAPIQDAEVQQPGNSEYSEAAHGGGGTATESGGSGATTNRSGSNAASTTFAGDTTSAAGGEERAPLFESDDAGRFRQRWESLQAGFVDQPRQSVEEADQLVAELMQRLTARFSEKRSELEAQWEQGDEVSTEDLRVALTRYRSFFDRLLSA